MISKIYFDIISSPKEGDFMSKEKFDSESKCPLNEINCENNIIRPLTGVYKEKRAQLMQQAADLLGFYCGVITEGNDYPLEEGHRTLTVKKGDVYITVQGKENGDYDIFWKTVKELETMSEQV